jgi:levanase/fructan beta-fructosidase
MLLYYTAAGGTSSLSAGKKFTQCLAYSADGGKTFKKYGGNPIVEHIEAANRDPKVVYVEELERFVMLLYLQKNDYAILTSEDLVHFTLLQKIEIQGDAECPDIFYLYCGGIKYWIIMGACDKYIVGRFEDGRFIAKSETKTLTHLKMSYAAQSFSGIEDGRAVRIAWNIINNPSDRFTSQMGIPTEMSLQMHNGELHLCCSPIKEIEKLYSSSEEKESLPLSDDAIFPLGECAADISLSCTLPPDEKLRMLIFGVEIICDNEKKELRCKNAKMPLLSEKLELRIIADKSSVEIYSEGGAAFVAVSALSDYNLPYFKLFKNENVTLDRVEVHGLKKIVG